MVADCTVLDPVGSSDHESVLFKLFLPHGGYSCDNSVVTVDSDDCNLVEYFCLHFKSWCIYLYTPTKRVCMSRSHGKKYPLYIRQLLRKKSADWRQYKHINTPQLKQLLKQLK